MQIDLRVSQLLCSRLCHDVVGAAGAVNAGMELLDDMGVRGDDAAGAMALVSNSARQLSARLAFFRMAFGTGGGRGAAPLADAREVAHDYLAENGAALDWPAAFEGVDVGALDMEAAKLVLNMVLAGVESLPRGGTVAVRLASIDGAVGIAVTAGGTGARIKEAARAAMTPDFPAADLTPHTVQPYFTRCLASQRGAALEIEERDGEVHLAALLGRA